MSPTAKANAGAGRAGPQGRAMLAIVKAFAIVGMLSVGLCVGLVVGLYAGYQLGWDHAAEETPHNCESAERTFPEQSRQAMQLACRRGDERACVTAEILLTVCGRDVP